MRVSTIPLESSWHRWENFFPEMNVVKVSPIGMNSFLRHASMTTADVRESPLDLFIALKWTI